MKRTGRVILISAVFAVAVVALTRVLPRGRRSPVAEALLRSPTTQVSGSRQWGFVPPIDCNQIILVPPDRWHAFSSFEIFSVATGDVANGRISSMQRLPTSRPSPGTKRRRSGYALARGSGMMFSTTPESEVIAIDELSLARIWTFTGANPVTRLIWSDSGTLVAASDTELCGVDPNDGQLRWSLSLQGTVETDLYDQDGKIFVCVDGDTPKNGRAVDPLLISVDARNGRTLWRTALPHLPLGVGGVRGEAIYCATQDRNVPDEPTLLRIEAASGRVAWESSDLGAEPSVLPRTARGPAVGNGVLCVALEGTVYALDAFTGKRRWTWSSPAEKESPTLGLPVIHDGIIYLAVTDGGVALDSQTGRELWNHRRSSSLYEARYPTPLGAPSVLGNVIALPYSDRRVDVARLPTTLRATEQPAAVAIRLPLAATAVALLLVGLIVAAFLRRLRGTIAALGLVALAMTLRAWTGSYSSDQFIGVKRFALSGSDQSEIATGIDWADGSVTFGRRQMVWNILFPRPTQGDATAPLWWTRRPPVILANGICLEEPATDLGLHRFAWTHRSRPSGTSLGAQAETSLTVPLWCVAALFALPPFAWLSGFWRDRGRHPKGHCTNCGYDLRATPGRCPECGHDPVVSVKDEGSGELQSSPDPLQS